MKYLVHALWFLAVLVAFVVGKSVPPSVNGQSNKKDSGLTAQEGPRGGGASGLSALATDTDAHIDAASRKLGGKVEIVASSMQEVLGDALRETDPLLRKQKIATILANLDASNVLEALAAFENIPRGDESDRMFRDFLHAWGRINGAAAIAYVMDGESKRRDHYGGSHAMSGWAMEDPSAATTYLAGIESEHAREWLHYGVVSGLMNTDLEAAAMFSEENKLGRARGRQMDRLMERYFETGGADGALGWLEGIDHTGENDRLAYKRYAARVTMQRLAREDPDRAYAWIEENATEPFVSGDTINSVVQQHFPSERPEARLDWINSLPEGRGRSEAVLSQVSDWARRDPNAAGEWLGENQDDPNYDPAAGAFAGRILETDPESAMAWVGTIQDPTRRQQTQTDLLWRWRSESPEAAAAWETANQP